MKAGDMSEKKIAKTEIIDSVPLSAEQYRQQTSELSDQLALIEEHLQTMPVSETYMQLVDPKLQSPGKGLAIRRVKNRWAIHYCETVPLTLSQVMSGLSTRLGGSGDDSLPEFMIKPLLSCSVAQKSWAATHLAEFLDYAKEQHRQRMAEIIAANAALKKLVATQESDIQYEPEIVVRHHRAAQSIESKSLASRRKANSTTEEGP